MELNMPEVKASTEYVTELRERLEAAPGKLTEVQETLQEALR